MTGKRKPAVKGQPTIARWFTPQQKLDQPNTSPLESAPSTGDGNIENQSPPVNKDATPSAKPVQVGAQTAQTAELPRHTNATGTAGVAYAEEVVGRALKVYWEADDAWYTGRVVEYSVASKQHKVLYEDGEQEWVQLAQEKIEWLLSGRKELHVSGARRKRLRKAAPVAVDDVDVLDIEDDLSDAADDEDEEEGSDWEQEAKKAPAVELDDDDMDVVLEEDGIISDDVPLATLKRTLPGKAPTSARKRAKGSPAGGTSTPRANTTPSSGVLPPSAAAQRSLSRFASCATPASGTPLVCTPATGLGSALALKTPLHTAGSSGTLGTPRSGAPSTAGKAAALLAIPGHGVDQWADRVRMKLQFLLPENLKDAQQRRPDHPDYDPRTLYIPSNWFKAFKISPGQQQWWEFKAQHFDSLLLFKTGKFYEIFEMDSHIGVEVLGLQYMKDERPHCGFPEVNYHLHAETLARAGLRVVVIEQTETPEMLEKRNAQRKAQGLTKCNIVRREAVAVLTVGTLTDPEMLVKQPNASYFMSIAELPLPTPHVDGATDGQRCCVWLGMCAVDCATGLLLVGQWYDDGLRSRLRAQLAALQPVELVLPKGQLSSETCSVLKTCLQSPRVNETPLGPRFWSAEEVVHELAEAPYFEKQQQWPHNYQVLCSEPKANAAALHALGGALAFLRDCLLDERLVPLGCLEALPGFQGVPGALKRLDDMHTVQRMNEHVTLDGAALENLEVLENSDGGTKGTLLAAVDGCVTPSGRRLMRDWLTRPLTNVKEIRRRQRAVQDLMGSAGDAWGEARAILTGMPDLERSLARMHAAANDVGLGRDAPHVVLYEDVSKRKVQQLVTAVKGLQTLQRAVDCFNGVVSECGPLLTELVSPGMTYPDLSEALQQLQTVADWDTVAATLTIQARQGIDEDYDVAVLADEEAEKNVRAFLHEFQAKVHSKHVKFISLNKDPYVLEVPQECNHLVHRSFELVGQRDKGKYMRYSHPDIRQLRQAKDAAQDAKEVAASGILKRLIGRVVCHAEAFRAAIAAVAQLDVLGSLAKSASMADGAMCVPTFVETGQQLFSAKALRHPASIALQGATFVPNDIELGGHAANFILLTGPNMGGKSTLLRQVCQATLLAQVGALVPADELTLSPVDAMFVRMGARDNIVAGQSTFFVELSETAMMLNNATVRSLVALDELGRGTATADGAAIAAAVLQHMAKNVRCRGLFATHYHRLADLHERDAAVAIKHMGCAVRQGQDGFEEVAFLYKLTDGSCPKSYGTNVARLAGLPAQLVSRAAAFAHDLEEAYLASQAADKGARIAGAVCAIAAQSAGENEQAQALLALQKYACRVT